MLMENTDLSRQSNTNKSSEPQRTIITLIEEHLEVDKKTLITKLSLQEKKQAEIEKIAKELKFDINNLAQTIQNILDKHHKDYISTFSTFMDTVRRDLKLKLEQMEKIEEEKRRLNDVNLIKCERDYFRSESIKLNTHNKELTNQIEDMGLRMRILIDEVNNVTIKWKESESANRQLALELEATIQSHKELEKELGQIKVTVQSLSSPNNNNNNNNSNDNQLSSREKDKDNRESEEIDKGQLLMYVDKLKMEMKREKARNSKMRNELNNILIEKNKLECIFIDCVEETRKNIFNRRLKGNINSRVRKIDDKSSIDINSKYDSFLPSDKKDILEHFVFNDEVSNVIREAIFTKPQSQKIQSSSTRDKLNKINLPIKDLTPILSPKEDKMIKTTNIIDNTRTTFFKTGRLTMTSFHHPSATKKLSFPLQIDNINKG